MGELDIDFRTVLLQRMDKDQQSMINTAKEQGRDVSHKFNDVNSVRPIRPACTLDSHTDHRSHTEVITSRCSLWGLQAMHKKFAILGRLRKSAGESLQVLPLLPLRCRMFIPQLQWQPRG